MVRVGLFLLVLSFIVHLLKDELKAVVEKAFKTVISVFQTVEFFVNDLKQRTRMGPPFDISLSRNLISLVWYGILLTGMVIAVIGNYRLLVSRLEAFLPFVISETNWFWGTSRIIAILITFCEVVMGYFLMMGWADRSFFRTDIDPTKPERPYYFAATMFVVSCVVYFLVLGIDVTFTYYGNYIQTDSVFSSILMALLSFGLSVVFGFLGFHCIMPFFIHVVAFLRNILSLMTEIVAFFVFLIHGVLNAIMGLLLNAIDALAKTGEIITRPFKRFQKQYAGEKFPVVVRIVIALLLLGLMSLAWSSPRNLSVSKKHFVILLDLTPSFDYLHESDIHIDEIIRNLMLGDELHILSINAASFYDKNFLFYARMPLPRYTSELYSKEFRADIDSIRTEFIQQWNKIAKNLKANAKKTDVMGGIGYAAMILNNSNSNYKYLVIYSDLEDNVAENCDMRLDSVRIWCLFVGHKHFEKFKAKEDSWRKYFKRAGVAEKDIIIRIPAQSSGIEIK